MRGVCAGKGQDFGDITKEEIQNILNSDRYKQIQTIAVPSNLSLTDSGGGVPRSAYLIAGGWPAAPLCVALRGTTRALGLRVHQFS